METSVKQYKRCSRCKKVKRKDSFHKNRSAKNGVKSRCKKCISETRDADWDNERNRRWRKNNPEKAKSKSKRFRVKNPEKQVEYNRRNHKNYKKRYPEKVKKQKQEDRDNLAGWYVRKCLKKLGIVGKAVTPELIEIHRAKILIRRLKKKINEKHYRPKKPSVRPIK